MLHELNREDYLEENIREERTIEYNLHLKGNVLGKSVQVTHSIMPYLSFVNNNT